MRDAAAAKAELEAVERQRAAEPGVMEDITIKGVPAAEEKQPCTLCPPLGRLFSAHGLQNHIRAKHAGHSKRRSPAGKVLQSRPPKRPRLQ